jgi:hypothetical protein
VGVSVIPRAYTEERACNSHSGTVDGGVLLKIDHVISPKLT